MNSICSPPPPPPPLDGGPPTWPTPTYILWASRQAQRRAYERGYRHGVAVALLCIALAGLLTWAWRVGFDRESRSAEWEAAHRAAALAPGRLL